MEKDPARAAELYAKAAEQDYPDGVRALGVCYENGTGVDKDPKRAVELYRRAIDLGDTFAAYCLGNMLYSGQDIPRDYTQALALYEKAAADGHPGAQCQAGFCYERGLGCEKDMDKAFSCYCKSAENDDEVGINNLGICYEHGLGCAPDPAYAAKLYEKAGSMGMPLAWKNLALLYEKGLGVEKDTEQARKYFTLAARENVPGAAEGLERLNGQPAAKRFPAVGLRITGIFLLGLAAFLGIGLWDGVPSDRLFSGVFTVFFIASAVFILCKVNQRQPELPKGLRFLYIILGAVLALAGVLILLSLPGGEEPVTAEDYWLVGCAILGGGALLYHALGRKKKKA